MHKIKLCGIKIKVTFYFKKIKYLNISLLLSEKDKRCCIVRKTELKIFKFNKTAQLLLIDNLKSLVSYLINRN